MKNLPRYKKCFVCGKENPIGLNLTFKTDGKKVYTQLNADEKYIGYDNRIHGGILASVLDEIMGWSCSIKTKNLYFTIELTIKYKKPAPPNEELSLEAEMVSQKRQICFAKALLKNKDGVVIATANGKYFPIEGEYESEVFRMLHHEPEDKKPVTKDDI